MKGHAFSLLSLATLLFLTSCGRYNPSTITSTAVSVDNGGQEEVSYTVTWVNWDGSVLESDNFDSGDYPKYSGVTPVRESENGRDYTFSGWSPKVAPVTSDITYTAQYSTTDSYTVNWLNWNGDVLETDVVSSGTVPTYDGETPVREGSDGVTYTFASWSPKVGPVYSNVSYTAQFTSEKSYTVTWKNWDGTVLEQDQGLTYGDMPSYDGATPTKPEESRHTFTFTGWTPEVTPVDSDVTYWANFTGEEITYTVTWLNYDGSVLETDTGVKYGTMPSYDGATPSEPSYGKTTFIFTGWSPELSPVYADVTYQAQFREDETFTVTWLDYDGTVLETDTQVPYGTFPSYDGATPTRASKGETSYSFSNWYPYPSAVYSDVTYTAQYSSTTIKYKVTFKDENGAIYQTSSYTKGSSVSQPSPTKETSEQGKIYVLKGWYKEGDDSKTLVTDFTVTGDATYIAVFELADQVKYRLMTKPNGEQYVVVVGRNDPSLTDIEIASTYQGAPVTTIAASAFQSTDIKSIKIPDSVTAIGDSAFNECRSLSSVTLPAGLTEMASYTFYGCRNLKSITLPSALTKIDDDAFAYSGLTSIDIPDGVTELGYYAFRNCSALTSISLPHTLTYMGMYVFNECVSLEDDVIIPASVATVLQNAFTGTFCNFYLEASSVPSGWYSTWNSGASGSVVYYSETSNTDGYHWHYDTDGKTPILWK